MAHRYLQKPAASLSAAKPVPGALPARLHVLLAREAPTAVIIRRGPSKQVCTIGWNRSSDRFIMGQWLKGRIYEGCCDLSPDGGHFLYFAANHKSKTTTQGSWIALSRAPYLKAVGLWGGVAPRTGGGLFWTNNSLWIPNIKYYLPIEEPGGFRHLTQYPDQEVIRANGYGLYNLRLLRDGWTRGKMKYHPGRPPAQIYEKALVGGEVLRKAIRAKPWRTQGLSPYFEQHELINGEGKTSLSCPDWEWADVDRERLVWCAHGKLFAAKVGAAGLQKISELFDFNHMRFEAIKAPYDVKP